MKIDKNTSGRDYRESFLIEEKCIILIFKYVKREIKISTFKNLETGNLSQLLGVPNFAKIHFFR